MKANKPIFRSLPKCVTPLQFKEWKAANRCTPANLTGFCQDCTPEYQSQMLIEGRCNHEEVVFRKNESLGVYGVIPLKTDLKKLVEKHLG